METYAKFIELRDAVDGSPFLLNSELIKSVHPAIEVGHMVIRLTDGDELIVEGDYYEYQGPVVEVPADA